MKPNRMEVGEMMLVIRSTRRSTKRLSCTNVGQISIFDCTSRTPGALHCEGVCTPGSHSVCDSDLVVTTTFVPAALNGVSAAFVTILQVAGNAL